MGVVSKTLAFNTPALRSDWHPPPVPSVDFYLLISGGHEVTASGDTGIRVHLSESVQWAPHDWIPVPSRLCAVWLRGSCKENSRRSGKRNLFVVLVHAPTNRSPYAAKDILNLKLHDLLRRSDIVILEGNMNSAADASRRPLSAQTMNCFSLVRA